MHDLERVAPFIVTTHSLPAQDEVALLGIAVNDGDIGNDRGAPEFVLNAISGPLAEVVRDQFDGSLVVNRSGDSYDSRSRSVSPLPVTVQDVP